MATSDDYSHTILFGGLSSKSSLVTDVYLNDCWIFHASHRRWSMLVTTASGLLAAIPSARAMHTAHIAGPYFFLHGGVNPTTGISNEAYRLDLRTCEWNNSWPTGVRAVDAPLAYRSSVMINGLHLAVFGDIRLDSPRRPCNLSCLSTADRIAY
jgi:hypothetical protein